MTSKLARPLQQLGVLIIGGLLGCSAPLPPAPEIESSVQPAGSERMAARLAAIAEARRPMKNAFMNRQRVDMMRALSPPAGTKEAFRAELRLAKEVLRSGDSQQAVDLLLALVERLEQSPSSDAILKSARAALAVAYLRLGEQQNCLERHSSESCLMPISEEGVHRLQAGSRAAMAEMTMILEQSPEDLNLRWLYNLAAMTVGDYPAQVPERWRISPQVFTSDYDLGKFEDRAPELGLATVGLAGGSVVEDLDGDGRLDIMVSSWGAEDSLHVLLSQEDGTFRDVTAEAGILGINGGLNLLHADFDNDGDADILVLRGAWLQDDGKVPNSLLENQGLDAAGNLFFEDVTEQVGILSFHPTQTAVWADFDNDGWLDLFIGNESLSRSAHPCELYRNSGPGEHGQVTFENVAARSGVAIGSFVKGVVAGDFDNDGRQDLYISRLFGRNLLFHNRSTPAGLAFREIGEEAGVAEPAQSFPTWSFDFDNDGWLDIFVSGYAKNYLEMRAAEVVADYLGHEVTAELPRVYRNLGAVPGEPPAFEDVTREVGLDRVLLGMGVNFGDLDNDGFLDFYVGTGAPSFEALVPNRMFRNAGGVRFQDVTTSGGFGHLQKGHGVSFGDIDQDGDQDVLTVLGGAFSGDVYPNALFVNPGHGHRWVTLRLVGTKSNRSAIGTRLRLEIDTPSGRRQIFNTVGTGGSFGSSSLQQEIGLGEANSLEVLEIRWPSGTTEILRDLPLDRILTVQEGSGRWTELVEP